MTRTRKTLIGCGSLVGLFLVIGIGAAIATPSAKPKPGASTATTPTNTPAATNPTSTPQKVATRVVTGKLVTLGAGTFTGGTDVADGLYNVTAGAGQSGNFIVSGTDSYDEIFGESAAYGGVPEVRAQISSGDQIQISGLSSVNFTPVTTPFVTTYTTTNLYAGTFTVGQDIGAGRYVGTPGAGQSGNFIVTGTDSYDEILGGSSADGGVPNVTVTLTKGDIIDISSLSQVTLTPTS